MPGTKYAFRARGGYGTSELVEQVLTGAGSSSNGGGLGSGITWGEFSVESSYATSGEVLRPVGRCGLLASGCQLPREMPSSSPDMLAADVDVVF